MKRAIFRGVLEVFAFSDPIRGKKGHLRALEDHAATGTAREDCAVWRKFRSIKDPIN